MAIDQQKLEREFVFKGRGPASEIVAALDQIPALEAKLRAKPQRIRWAALGVFVVLLIVAIATTPEVGFLAIAISLPLFIYSLFSGGPPIQRERVEVLRSTLTLLSHDAGTKSRFEVELRLREQRDKVSEGPNPGKGGGKLALFRDQWLTVRTRLADGNDITETFIDLIRQRTRVNSRGKSKSKQRRHCLVRVQMQYNTKLYGTARAASGRVQHAFRLPPWATVKGIRATDQSLDIKAVVTAEFAARHIHASSEAMLLGAYRILNLARRRAAATQGTT